MKENAHIKKFCIIRHGMVMVGQDVLLAEKKLPVQEFLKKAYRHFRLEYPKFHKMDNLSKLGFLAAELLLRNNGEEGHGGQERHGGKERYAGQERHAGKERCAGQESHGGEECQLAGDRTGIIFANAASSLDTDRNYQRSIDDRGNYFPSPSVFVYTLPNIVMGEICIRHQIYGENTFFIQEKFDIPFIHHYVDLLFENGILDRCPTGWIEMDGDDYEAVLYLAEKTAGDNVEIAIFDAENMKRIYALKG